jgi:hypothetical protein
MDANPSAWTLTVHRCVLLDAGGENVAANAILADVLVNAAAIAKTLNDVAAAAKYSTAHAALVTAINTLLWDEAVRLYLVAGSAFICSLGLRTLRVLAGGMGLSA